MGELQDGEDGVDLPVPDPTAAKREALDHAEALRPGQHRLAAHPGAPGWDHDTQQYRPECTAANNPLDRLVLVRIQS